MKTYLLVSMTACFFSCSINDSGITTSMGETSLAAKEFACKSYEDDSCCDDDRDSCDFVYGQNVAEYLGFQAKSNGYCMNSGYGAYQCVSFVQGFYKTVLRMDLGSLGDAGRFIVNTAGKEYLNKEIFVYDASSHERPRETDILVFSKWYLPCLESKSGNCVRYSDEWKEWYGHVVLVSGYSSETKIRVIEENVSPTACIQAPLPSYGRELMMHKGSNYVDAFNAVKGPDFEWSYLGFIRHNLAGIYHDVGWHDDGTSRAFRDAYLAVLLQYPGKSLGWAFDDTGGGPFVHEVRGVTLQNFVNTNPDNHFGTDGQTALVMNATGNVRLIKEGFWGAYKCIPGSDGEAMGGAEYLGAPTTGEEYGQIDGSCRCTANTSTPKVMYQLFEGGCLWWRPDEVDAKIHIHLTNGMQVDTAKAETCGVKVENNPPSADCHDDCTPGTQQCLNANQIQICGHPGTDSCYHWLTLSCANGLTCRNNECTTSATVSIATVSSGGSFSGGASSVGGNASTGGSSGAQRCIQSAHRCISNPSVYQICILDSYTGTTDWMSFDCPSGQSCDSKSGNCAINPAASTGGASSIGGASSVSVSIASISSSGGRSIGGSSSNGGMSSVSSGGSGSIAGTSSSNAVSTGGAGFANPISSGGTSSAVSAAPSVLHLHYEGPITGRYWIGGWWNALNGRTDITWESSLLACQDQDSGDTSLDCDLTMIPQGAQDVQFQIYLPDGRFWGDESCNPTGGCGATIGTVVLTSGSMTLSYVMKPNQFGAPYYNGWLSVVP